MLHLEGLESHKPIGQGKNADRAWMRVELLEAIEKKIDENPRIGAILVECSMIAPYSNDMRRKFGLPVYDYMTLFNFLADSLSIM